MTELCTHPTGCPRVQYAKGLCKLHYQRELRNSPKALEPAPEVLPTTCAFVGPYGPCERPVKCRGYCKPHYEQFRSHQELRTLKDAYPKECRICGDPVYIIVKQLCQSCFDAERRAVERAPRECINCPNIFTPKRSDHFACSGKCSMENARLKHKYGITGRELNALLAAQGGKCWTCERSISRGGDKYSSMLHVDHDHACCPGARSCGKCIRKLLCWGCNSALGLMEDREDVAYALGDYLAEFHAKRIERLGQGELFDAQENVGSFVGLQAFVEGVGAQAP